MKINEDFIAQMQKAAQLLQTEGPMAATAAVQRALHGAAPDGAASPSPFAYQTPPPANVVDINPAFSGAGQAQATSRRSGIAGLAQRLRAGMGKLVVEDVEDVATETADPLKGKFLRLSCTAPAGTRAYKLYIPSTYAGEPASLVVMLHGCKQNPDDFAAGTGMNALAEEQGCLVVYPAQAKNANGSNCWNWFQADDQRRDRGEPSIIAAITQQVMRDYKVDPARVYVAGLSAGGAMAAILASEYPELYKAAGIHSGLPTGAAHDVPSAFAAMSNGAAAGVLKAKTGATVPVIVFHGDRDKTVHPQNGHQVLAQQAGAQAGAATTEKGSAPNGRSYTRAIHRSTGGKLTAEHWTVHGSGHAWSGGSKRGSYTDPKGPDASREMLRFFSEAGK
jgi:poly(hydroxyalkanoate) depolymerase family esterase